MASEGAISYESALKMNTWQLSVVCNEIDSFNREIKREIDRKKG